MPVNALKTEAELRNAVIDRLIAASLRDGKPAREATLARWRAIAPRPVEPTSQEPNAA
ncbi:MAG TPA: hypothetical protein VNC39_13245 [Acidocella sp.]|jgi:hypothetical protein|uniref:hypothetical protein n=1 Tax=Acidocella sp. TaxID=50710 RepID=UPI002C90B7D8|nr:hypothetical protein [Acidocella sp.]HVE22934.1 hypothetical protein [Acidocella sp.]